MQFELKYEQGRHSWGAQGAQAPPKLGGRKLTILQKGGLKPPQYSSLTGKVTLFKPFRASLSKKIFETPQYLAPNGAPEKIHMFFGIHKGFF